MNPRFKYIIKWCSVLGSSTLVAWTLYESYGVYSILKRPLAINCLEQRNKAEFIYLKRIYLREPVRDFLNEFFEEETKIYSFLYNLKRKMTFTRLEYALKTLRVAKNADNDQFIRRKAIRNLSSAKLDELDDWEFHFLAQYVNASTAICLARNNCNPNLIRKPREFSLVKSNFDIVSDVKSLLDLLKEHKCVKFILETTSAFESLTDHDMETSLHELHNDETEHIFQSLEHFLHLTTKPELCLKIAENNGFEILLNIYKNFNDNADIKTILSKIVTNMSAAANDNGIIDYFYKSGWIYLLSKWQVDEDLRIQVFASTSLNNLDKFDSNRFVYKPKLYPLYPRNKTDQKPDLDLLFVHGLLGGIWITWRVQRDDDMLKFNSNGNNDKKEIPQVLDENLKNSFFQEEAVFRNEKIIQMEPSAASKILTITEQTTKNVLAAINEMAQENLSMHDLKLTRKILKHLVNKINEQKYSYCWPIDWLPQQFPNIRILGLQFESSLSYWTSKVCACENNKRRLKNISMDYLERLKDAGIGQRPIMWVCHSMGGLIVKYIINLALSSNDPKIKQIGENSRGIVFLGVPHRGSIIAKLSQQTSLLWPTVEVKDLEENSKELLKLNEQFLENVMNMKTPVEIVSIAEGATTKIFQNIKLHVVPIKSSYLGYGDFYISNENHLNLSKPLSQNSFIYLTVVSMIKSILNKNKNS